MKKVTFFAFLMFLGAALVVSSCDDDDDDKIIPTNPEEVTGEDENESEDADEDENVPAEVTVTFEGAYWDALIDDPQYGGGLLYGSNANDYEWTDEETSLHGGLTLAFGGTQGFSEGGSAISNYIDADIQGHNTYFYQLAVPESNGSDNFVVVFCDATLTFADGIARQVKSMDITPTTYLLGVELYGDGYAKALTEEGDYLTLTITTDNGDSMDIDLARDGEIMEGWNTIDLSSLGEVKSLSFTMTGSDGSEWDGVFYLNSPLYFAFDNVVVVQ